MWGKCYKGYIVVWEYIIKFIFEFVIGKIGFIWDIIERFFWKSVLGYVIELFLRGTVISVRRDSMYKVLIGRIMVGRKLVWWEWKGRELDVFKRYLGGKILKNLVVWVVYKNEKDDLSF